MFIYTPVMDLPPLLLKYYNIYYFDKFVLFKQSSLKTELLPNIIQIVFGFKMVNNIENSPWLLILQAL